VDHVEELERVLDLVRLQVPDQVPGRRPPELGHLRLGLLDAVLAERAQARGQRRPDALDVDRLRHADQEHVVGPPPRARRRSRDPLAHPLEILPDIRHARF